MKVRKILSILLSMMLVATIFVGCGGSKGDSQEVNILYPGDESNRMTEFLDKEFAEVMKKDLGIKLKVTFVPWDQYWEKKDIMLAAKEPIDLYWDGLPDLSTFVNKQQAQPLDDLIQKYGQNMIKVIPQEQLQGGKIKGVTYGIPSAYAPSSSMFQLVCLRQDLLEAVGMKKVETPEDLMEYSIKVKKQFPEIKGGGDPLFKPLTRYYGKEQYHWIASQELVVFGEETNKAYSYFETEAFQKLSKFNRKMSLAGQYTDDVTIKYNERDSRVQSGAYIWVEGSLGKENEIIAATRKNTPNAVLKSYLLAPEKQNYITAAGGEVLCIPKTAPNAVGAMKFLNWMYSSQKNYNMALYGVEGKDFKIINGRIKRINTEDLFYEWMFRNKNFQMFAPEIDQSFIDTYQKWDDNAKISTAFGFAFDNSKVKEIEAKLNSVAGKILAPIRSGFVDYDTEYPKAIKKLKEAGIDKYVAEVQRQLDEFLKTK